MPYPSSERLIGCLTLCPSLKCEVIDLYWLSAYPLLCEVVFVLVVPCLCERLYSVERGVVYSRLFLPQTLIGGSLCVSPVWIR